jgi:hypothetical protein
MPSELVILPASVSVEACDADGQRFYLIKVGTAAFEINVRVAARDASRFSSVLATQWESGALRIGECAGAPVFWCAGVDRDSVSVLVGHDDQTWDVGLELPPATVGEIIDCIGRASK